MKALALGVMFLLGALAEDLTVQDKASGADVVQAVVDIIQQSCVFANDKLLLRRVSYVESRDGTESFTFTRGGKDYYGGIWQVDEADFDRTKVRTTYHAAILDKLQINWAKVQWTDLWKPLYSGLAARIRIEMDGAIARSVAEQANYWANTYHPGKKADEFTKAVGNLDEGCDIPQADITIVMDGSGSIQAANFDKMKNFVKELIDGFNIGDRNVRVGVIKYSDKAQQELVLGRESTKTGINSVVDGIKYEKGGTNSADALQAMRDMFNQDGRTQSKGAPRIGIFMTDGKSNDVDATKIAAKEVHADKITVFAVGVTSGVVRAELETIGSDPDCIHVSELDNFDEITHFKAQLERQACSAPAELDPDFEVDGSIKTGQIVYFKMKVRKNGIHIKIKMVSGGSTLYVSFKVRNPGRAINSYKVKFDTTMKDGGAIYIPYPPGYTSDMVDVFTALQGDGVGATNQYKLSYGQGTFSGSEAFAKPSMILLALACLLRLLV